MRVPFLAAASMEVEIPPNTTAEVSFPKFISDDPRILESGRVVWFDGQVVPNTVGITNAYDDGDSVVFSLGSGSYSFVQRGADIQPTSVPVGSFSFDQPRPSR